MQSLAEFLGTEQPPAERSTAPRVEDITDAKSFAEAVLNSHEFRSYVLNSLSYGSLPAAVITRLMDYAWGKPIERVEVADKSERLEDLTPEIIEQKLERVGRMLQLIRSTRDDTAASRPSVH